LSPDTATGCRRGELLALEWSDLDEATSEIYVSKSLEQTKAGLRIKCTKSEEPRHFPVPAWALEVLRAHREEQQQDRALFGPGYEDHNLVFCQPQGAYYPPDHLGARVVELMRKVGLEGVSLHSLRHSHASSLLSKWCPHRRRVTAPGPLRPEHHALDLQPRDAGRHSRGGGDLERRHWQMLLPRRANLARSGG
jgi:integrase